jgi:hypothetical protein
MTDRERYQALAMLAAGRMLLHSLENGEVLWDEFLEDWPDEDCEEDMLEDAIKELGNSLIFRAHEAGLD